MCNAFFLSDNITANSLPSIRGNPELAGLFLALRTITVSFNIDSLLEMFRDVNRETPLALATLGSSACDDFDNFQAVALRQRSLGELRRRHRLPIMFDHHAAGEQVPLLEELFDGAGELGGDLFPVGDDKMVWHQAVSAASQSFQTGS